MPDKLGILTLDPASRQEYFDQMAHESKKYGTDLYSFSPLIYCPARRKQKDSILTLQAAYGKKKFSKFRNSFMTAAFTVKTSHQKMPKKLSHG